MQKEKTSAGKKQSPEDAAFAGLQIHIPAIRIKLLRWYDRNSRKYPWRKTGNWFHLLMAEMMLRRTKADQVLPVYKIFTEQFKTPSEAASLPASDFKKMMHPLGLSWRSLQMQETINYLKDNYSKRQPEKSDNLKNIPGVGDYANAMLRNKLFNERCAAVDSNVVRFLSRLAGIAYHPENRRKYFIKTAADSLMNSKRSFDLNLAILDYTALVCKIKKPLCLKCSFKELCRYGGSGYQI